MYIKDVSMFLQYAGVKMKYLVNPETLEYLTGTQETF